MLTGDKNIKLLCDEKVPRTWLGKLWVFSMLVLLRSAQDAESKKLTIGIISVVSTEIDNSVTIPTLSPKARLQETGNQAEHNILLNWSLDGTADISENVKLVKEEFRRLYNNSQVSFALLHIRINLNATIGSIIQGLQENKDKCDAFVFNIFDATASTSVSRKRDRFCALIEEVVTKWDVPTFTGSCPFDEPRIKGSTLLYLKPSLENVAKSVIATLHHFRWRNIGWLTTSLTPMAPVCREIEKQLLLSNYFAIKFSKEIQDITFYTEQNRSALDHLLYDDVWKPCEAIGLSAIVTCLPVSFAKNEASLANQLLESAYTLSEAVAKRRAYVAVTVDGFHFNYGSEEKTEEILSKSRRSTPNQFHASFYTSLRIAQVLRNAMGTRPTTSHVSNIDDVYHKNMFTHSLIQKRSVARSEMVDEPLAPDQESLNNLIVVSPALPSRIFLPLPSEYNAADILYFMDSLLLAMVSLSQAMADRGPRVLKNGRFVLKKGTQIGIKRGFSGAVLFDNETGCRQMNFTVWDVFGREDNQPESILHLIPDARYQQMFEVIVDGSFTWSADEPLRDSCDQPLYLCSSSGGSWLQRVLIVIACGAMLYIIANALFGFLRWRKDKQNLVRGPNKLLLTRGDLTFADHQASEYGFAAGYIIRTLPGLSIARSPLTAKNQTLRSYRVFISPTTRSFSVSSVVSREGSLARDRQSGRNSSSLTGNSFYDETSQPTGTLQGERVFLKKICRAPIEIKKVTRDTLKQLRELHHENVAAVYGMFTSSKFHYLVTEFGSRRSLHELLERNEFELNVTFKLSLIYDLVRGMKYIHSSPISHHGRLKSSNCIVDGRFALKVTDHGVNKTRNSLSVVTDYNNAAVDLLWTAPELLNDPALRQVGSKYGDYYSFGIICQEIILRKPPFAMHELSSEEVIERVKKLYLRPHFSEGDTPREIVTIAKRCWIEKPEERMTFNAVYSEIKRMNRGKKHNIVEFMMKQLEDHSKHLEEEVCKRTNELSAEKQKTEQLLMRMLPPSVVLRLMANEVVEPESFEKCTIYFSDICGFTTIALNSTPMQVVSFLNDLYTCFDAIIANYDTYKIETIGDAYMISSGIPKRIGDRHAEEAALMALHVLSATSTFRIKHRPEMELQIRIGMHSGPAVAGVVGLTMPRYCLFGDTINTASRLETTGMRNRIHVSADTKVLLAESKKQFILERKGITALKGRGDMETWWLVGMKGYTRPLPTPGDVSGPNHGLNQITSKSLQTSGNKSSNNSKVSTIDRVNTELNSLLGEVLPGATRNEQHSANISTRAPATFQTIRSGSSFVIPTPLALLPHVTSSELSQAKSSRTSRPGVLDKQMCVSQTKVRFDCSRQKPEKKTHLLRNAQAQLSAMLGRKMSVSPSPNEVFTLDPSAHDKQLE